MYITEMYEDVYEVYGDDDAKFLQDMWYEDNDFCRLIESGDTISEHKCTYQDLIFQMNSDGRIFRYILVKDNSGYWGDGETYFEDCDVEEVEKKAITVYQWVSVKRD